MLLKELQELKDQRANQSFKYAMMFKKQLKQSNKILNHMEDILISDEVLTIKYGDENHLEISEANKTYSNILKP